MDEDNTQILRSFSHTGIVHSSLSSDDDELEPPLFEDKPIDAVGVGTAAGQTKAVGVKPKTRRTRITPRPDVSAKVFGQSTIDL